MSKSVPPYNMRLRGLNPLIEADASNLSIVMDSAGAGVACRLAICHGSNTAFLISSTAEPDPIPGVMLSASDRVFGAVDSNDAALEPFMSFRTAVDKERLRIDSNGVVCDSFTADVFTNLVDTWDTQDVFKPPTAAALTNAYIELSNMFVMGGGGAGGTTGGSGNVAVPALVNSFTSTSVLQAPTANALRASYYSLSNLLAVKLLNVINALPGISTKSSGGSNTVVIPVATKSFQLSNDVWLQSLESQPRFKFDTDGPTTFASVATTSNNDLFRWFDNDMQQDVMRLTRAGDLYTSGGALISSAASFMGDVTIANSLTVTSNATVSGLFTASNVASFASNVSVVGDTRLYGTASLLSNVAIGDRVDVAGDMVVAGNVAVSGGITMSSNAGIVGNVGVTGNLGVGGTITMGGVATITHDGTNIGINLPDGEIPMCSLHVNGAVFSTEQLFALSDSNVKTDIVTINNALEKLSRIKGCTYKRIDDPSGASHVGVIAQEVLEVVPEAVQQGSDGRLSVAYGSLVAVAIQGINELRELVTRQIGALTAVIATPGGIYRRRTGRPHHRRPHVVSMPHIICKSQQQQQRRP